jgi:hypothetical protein
MKLMKTGLSRRAFALMFAASPGLIWTGAALAADYAAPQPLKEGAQADIKALKNDGKIRIAYMPPATEFNYYIAIGEGIKAEAAAAGVDTFMLAPQSGSDINGQMGMIQDVITQDVDAIILSTQPPTRALWPKKPSAIEERGCCSCRPIVPISIPSRWPSPSLRHCCEQKLSAPSTSSGRLSGKSASSSAHRNARTTSPPLDMDSIECPML